MKNLFRNMLLGLTLVFCLLVGTTSSQVLHAEDQKPLQVQFVPTNNDGSIEAKAKPLGEYLSKKLGREVKVTLATDYSTIVQAMSSGQVDLGIMPPAAYVQARNLNAAEAILTSELGKFDPETGLPLEGETTGTFKAEVLVKADSEIETLEDLVGKRIATLSPASASGFIYPIAEMKEKGINVKDLTLTTVNDIPSMITSILNGQQDAMFSFQGTRIVFGKAFPDNDLMKDLKVIYLSEGDIPNDAIAVQPTMDDELREKIKEAFLTMGDTEEGQEIMSLWSHIGYTEADEAAYDTVEDYTKIAAE